MPPDRLVASRSQALSGEAAVPGDKSLSHRSLIFAALAEGESRIEGLSDAEDVRRTAEAVRAFGSEVRRLDGTWHVRGNRWRTPPEPIDCGNSGTTARLLMGAAAGQGVRATFAGDESLSARPMARIVEPLRAMGARIEGGDRLPITLDGGTLHAARHASPVASAQVKSALLLAGLGAYGTSQVVEPLLSRDHTERLLPAFGVDLQTHRCAEGFAVTLAGPQRLRATEVRVPGDISSAVFLLAAALIVPDSEVTVAGVGVNPLRIGLLDTVEEMGAHFTTANLRHLSGEPAADLTARTARLRGVTVPAERAPRMIDEYPLLAIVAACAEGMTVMHGLAELRHKESDRLAAIAAGLAACGVEAEVEVDTLRVRGGRVPGGARIHCRGDHRIAMAFLVLGLVSEAPIIVEGAGMIATSFPSFTDVMRSLGARIEPA